MKLFLLSLIWFPTTLMIVFLSLTTLLNFEYYNKSNIAGTSQYSSYLFNLYNSDYENWVKSKLPDQDARLIVLRKFLSDYKSPLIEASEEIIKQSDIYGIDYALIPSIAMQESGGCKVIPPGSHNCWGFGIYGKRKVVFNNFEEAITAVAKTIKEAYINNGLTNPTLWEDRWTPSSIGNWSYSVNYFIGKIRQYERNLQTS